MDKQFHIYHQIGGVNTIAYILLISTSSCILALFCPFVSFMYNNSVSGLRAERSEASKSAQRRVRVITRTLPRNAPWFEKCGFDPLHCHLPASLPAKPTFILQHFAAFQAQFLPSRLTSASPLHNHRQSSAAVLCHAKAPAPTRNRTKFHPHLAHTLTPTFAKTLCQKRNLPRRGRCAGKAFISRSTWNVPACLAA